MHGDEGAEVVWRPALNVSAAWVHAKEEPRGDARLKMRPDNLNVELTLAAEVLQAGAQLPPQVSQVQDIKVVGLVPTAFLGIGWALLTCPGTQSGLECPQSEG